MKIKSKLMVIIGVVAAFLVVVILFIYMNNNSSKVVSFTDVSNVGSDANDVQSYWSSSGHSFAKGEDGYYFLTETGRYLMYFDENSKEIIPVCGKADCEHNSMTCNAYLGNAQFLPDSIYFYKGNVYLIAYHDGKSYLTQVNADGSGRKEIAELLPSDGGSSIRLVFHDDEVYVYDRWGNYSYDNEINQVIKRVSLTDGTGKNVYEYKAKAASIDNGKTFGDKLFFMIKENSRDEKTSILTVKSNGLYTYDYKTKETGLVLDDNIFDYYVDTENNFLYYFVTGEGLYKMDMKTRDKSMIFEATEKMGMCNLSYDGKYLYLDNFVYCSSLADSKEYQYKKCVVLDSSGKVINTIDCKNYLIMYYGDENFMFALRPGEGAMNGLVYIDKKNIETVKEWTLVSKNEIDLLNSNKDVANSQTENATDESATNEEVNIAEQDGVEIGIESNEVYAIEVVKDKRQMSEGTKITSKLRLRDSMDSVVNNVLYRCQSFRLDTLFQDESIETIEYLLENCPGKLMMDVYDPKKHDSTDVVKAESYTTTVDNQENVGFTVLLNLENKDELNNKKELEMVTKVIENARLKVVLTHTDGTTEEKFYGFKQYSQYNYNNFDMYELTLGDE